VLVDLVDKHVSLFRAGPFPRDSNSSGTSVSRQILHKFKVDEEEDMEQK